MTLNKALSLSEAGYFVHPVRHGEDNSKTPLTPHGHLDATRDPNVIMDWWDKFPEAKVGVACGKSGILVVDIDTKNGKDGWGSLDAAWVDLGEPSSYETGTGGSHLVYLAPEDKHLSPSANYRGMAGVDIRAGESWVLWAGDVVSKSELSEAPEWALDEKTERAIQGFEGTVQEWYEGLVAGEPNVMVRRAMERINPDMSHEQMVSATYEAIRLGAEGCPGVPELIEALEEAWMNRPAENHTTPESSWDFKFKEALLSGLEKYGDTIQQLKDLPEYSIGLLPPEIPDSLVTQDTGKPGFSKLLAALVNATEDDQRIASILWNCPATKNLSRDWGFLFILKRIQEARVRPEPTRENPRLEEERERAQETPELAETDLLSEEQRTIAKNRPVFKDYIENAAKDMKYNQFAYFRDIAWTIQSMACGFKGFIPVSDTQRHGLNIWGMVLGYSGTGKSVTLDFRDQVLRVLFQGDNGDGMAYDLGTDSSPQGLHLALLERDKKSSLFAADEASGFFKSLGKKEWDLGLEDSIAKWYGGYVSPSNKISLKDLRGKAALTNFVVEMFATPDRLTEVLDREQFKSGFLARFHWVIGDPPKETRDRFRIFKPLTGKIKDESTPQVVLDIAADIAASVSLIDSPKPLEPTGAAVERFEEMYERMYNIARVRDHWDLTEPSVTRLMESALKVAGLCAMYRMDHVIREDDAIQAIAAVEEWFSNLFVVAEMISAGSFQRSCNEIEEWIKGRKGGKATRAQVYYQFKNFIQKDSRELDNYLMYLQESGSIVRHEENNSVYYQVNGH